MAKPNENGEPIEIEIFNASAFIQEAVLDTGFAKGLSLASVQTT